MNGPKLRFRTEEDAKLFLKCVADNKSFPPEKWVPMFEVIGGLCVLSKDYHEAPFELDYFYGPTDKIVNA